MMPVLAQPIPHVPPSPSAGCRLVAPDGRELPLRSATLRSEARAGLARTLVVQHFVNVHREPLSVTYQLPLPADGAVSGFSFDIAGERVVGVIEGRARARERYEEALIEGRTAALLEEDRSSLFTQEVGNIPPGGDVRIEIIVDHPLKWLSEGSWQWRFPTVVAPRYLGAAGSVADAERIEVDVSLGDLAASCRLELEVRDALSPGGRISSNSHALTVRHTETQAACVGLANDGGALLDRDVVVEWPVAQPAVGVEVDVARPAESHARANSAFALLTLVPPRLPSEPLPRDLIVLLDTSGSMGGEPLDQAKRVVGALIQGLEPRDRIELIEFSMRPRRFHPGPLEATPAHKAEALAWLQALAAAGGTEMHSGIVEALTPLRPLAQRQVLLVTDGLIGAEERIVAEVIERLPQGCRVHTLGIGSGVNRSLTGPVARAGRGSEHIAELGGNVEAVVERVLAHLERPVLVDLELSGPALRSLAGTRLPDLMAGSPALVAVEVDPEGGALELRGRTRDGVWRERVLLPSRATGQGNPALPALFARERVEDLEMCIAANARRDELERDVERHGLDFGISTRLTSWVAVSQQAHVDPTEPTRRVTQPQALPHGMSVAGLGLRAARPLSARAAMSPMPAAPMLAAPAAYGAAPPQPKLARGIGAPPRSRPVADERGFFERVKGILRPSPMAAKGSAEAGEPPVFRSIQQGTAESSLEPTPGRLVLRGRVVLQKGQLLVIEASVDDGFVWSLPEEAELELSDGGRVTLAIVKERSTASGQFHGGETLRLVLRVDSPLGVVHSVLVDALQIELAQR